MPMDAQTLRGRAAEVLARDPDATPALPTRDMQELVLQLQLYETELEISNEDLRATERELAASRDRYAVLYDSAPAGYLTLDSHDRIIEANLPAGRMLGVSRDHLVKAQRFSDFVVPEDRETWRRFRQAASEKCKITLTRGDTARWVARVEVSLLRVEAADEQTSMVEMFDVTQEHKIEEQLRRTQRLESVGRLAGGVAHDFNNMLMGILGYTRLCRDELPPDHSVQGWLSELEITAKRSADLTRQLLAFARRQPVTVSALDLNVAVAGMLKLLGRLIGEDIELTWHPGANLWPVKLDPTQVDQIMTNLCVNARDAADGTGKLVVETRNATLDEAYCSCRLDVSAGEYVGLTFHDDGRGMDSHTLDHVFEPFFTTKGVGKGTGMGLATVFGIVKQTGGAIEVSSQPGKGTTFTLYFPRCADEVDTSPNVATETCPRGRETILLVEDEKSVRVTTSAFLDSLGYTVLAEEHPADALRLAADASRAVDLLITDVVMPGMNGHVLAERLLTERPSMRCLYMSGYPADALERRGLMTEGVECLPKPFTKDTLARKVREILDR